MENKVLFAQIHKLVRLEKRIGVKVLECLFEIEKRKAYAELHYDGLYTFCIKELGFSDSEAYQRIQAMWALKKTPELKPMLEAGSITVSAINKVEAHFKNEERFTGVRIDREEKRTLYQSLQNQTVKQVSQTLAEMKGEAITHKLMLELDSETLKLWNRAKGLLAHQSRGNSVKALEIILKDWLEKNDPLLKEKHKSRRSVPWSTRNERVSSKVQIKTRHIPSAIRDAVWKRDQGKCSKCNSTHAIELDHVIPFALGGEHHANNLRLLCRSCNQYRARKTFGFGGLSQHHCQNELSMVLWVTTESLVFVSINGFSNSIFAKNSNNFLP